MTALRLANRFRPAKDKVIEIVNHRVATSLGPGPGANRPETGQVAQSMVVGRLSDRAFGRPGNAEGAAKVEAASPSPQASPGTSSLGKIGLGSASLKSELASRR